MNPKNLRLPLGFFLGVLLALFLLHVAGTVLYLYWRVPVYDRLVHVIGGFWIAAVTVALAHIKIQRRGWLALLGLVATLGIGLLWELFELRIGFTDVSDVGYFSDTVSDLISDGLGGFIGLMYIFSWHSKQN